MKEVFEKTPFREPLINMIDDKKGHLYAFQTNNNFIIRKNPVMVDKRGEPFLHEIEIAMVIFKELEKDYKISVAPFDTVVGLYETDVTAFMVVDRIEGNRIPEVKIEEQDARTLFSSLLTYHKDKYQQGGFFVADLNVNDFVYGKTRDNPTNKIYFVDLDAFYEHFNNLYPGERNEYFAANLEFLNDLLNRLEKQSGLDLSDLRKEFMQFLREIKNTLHPEDQKNIKDTLSSAERRITEGMEAGLPKRRF